MTYETQSALLRGALDAAERGWHVFPLIPGDKRPAIRNWTERATTDTSRITRCWNHAPYNIGVATGPSNLLVVDLDTPKTPDDLPPTELAGPGICDGRDVFLKLCLQHTGRGELAPDTHSVATTSGGHHLYFTAPADIELRNTAGKLGWKIDTRANGGYVVGAGSAITGKTAPYRTVVPVAPQPVPAWLLDLLRPAPLPPQAPVTVMLGADRHTRWLQVAINGELERVARSADHEHNNALYIASVALGQLVAGGELTEADVTGWLADAADKVGQGDREARATIASGLRAGARRPRKVAS
ncbi:bifunctional DNA primase/polymerase [Streptomyces sp. DSM 41634]|uniref:bifunctional DNA primase/polymerase n=1 Tax=Streptomyces sp. DSM 41634 TaxID=3448656 RepID=UPI0028854574|nr:bifunctional DNA primase/polymerase [Streptomyces sp. DSM 41633]